VSNTSLGPYDEGFKLRLAASTAVVKLKTVNDSASQFREMYWPEPIEISDDRPSKANGDPCRTIKSDAEKVKMVMQADQ
jgi:hypothetical protein